jgi:hypothetical protein
VPLRPYDGTVTAWLLAHQGGWDEILLVAGPLLLIAGVLFLANRRAREFARQADEEDREAAGRAADGGGAEGPRP